VFYRDATFYSADDVAKLLVQAGYSIDEWGQTLAHSLSETHFVEPLQPGYGQCAFVVVSAQRREWSMEPVFDHLPAKTGV